MAWPADLRPAIDIALIVRARVRRNGRGVGVVDVDVANESGVLLTIGRASYTMAG
jgi:acyl-coenzyme A thioesterase PaaI-like protein